MVLFSKKLGMGFSSHAAYPVQHGFDRHQRLTGIRIGTRKLRKQSRSVTTSTWSGLGKSVTTKPFCSLYSATSQWKRTHFEGCLPETHGWEVTYPVVKT